jgi:hypothetical protein
MQDAISHTDAKGGTVNVRKSNRWFYFLIAGLVLLTLVGLALLGAYFLTNQARPAAVTHGWVNPLEAVHSSAVAPDMAVLPLAGYADERAVDAALDAGELDTAYTTLAYSTLTPDALRIGRWLLLAQRLQASDPQRAAIAYQTALDQSALAAGLNDVARADASLQIARGLAVLGDSTASRLALAQAENIARYSLTLLPAQRRNLLQQVANGYQAAGDAQTAAAIRAKLDSASAGPGIKVEPAAPLLPTLRGSVVLSAQVTEALAARQRAAANLANGWLKAAPGERKNLAAALGQALETEDTARADFYTGAAKLSTADKLALMHDKVSWLTVKYEVARGVYGTSLVPGWEKQAEDIRTQLASAYTDLINGYGQQLDTLSAGDATLGRVELLRQGVLWTRLGLFPDHAEEALSQQLTDASRQLWTRQGGAGLVIVAQQAQGARYYLLAGSDAPQTGQ